MLLLHLCSVDGIGPSSNLGGSAELVFCRGTSHVIYLPCGIEVQAPQEFSNLLL